MERDALDACHRGCLQAGQQPRRLWTVYCTPAQRWLTLVLALLLFRAGTCSDVTQGSTYRQYLPRLARDFVGLRLPAAWTGFRVRHCGGYQQHGPSVGYNTAVRRR